MSTKAILCIDSESYRNPELIGLPDENLAAQSWLSVYLDALKVRNDLLCGYDYQEIWVISSDSMDGINLAAALKADDGRRQVSFVTFEMSGSVFSRCSAAGINVLRGVNEFVRAYAACKKRCRDIAIGEAEKNNLTLSINSNSESNVALGNNAKSEIEIDLQPAANTEATRAKAKFELLPNVGMKSDSDSISALGIDESVLNLSKAAAPAKEKKAGYTIAVVSGSGGSGKSAISLCAGMIYQKLGFKTLILDGDLQFGDMSYMLGRDDALTITELIEEPKRISRVVPDDGLPAIIAAPNHLEHSELVMTHMAEIIEFVKSYFDIVVINTGSFWSEQHAQIIETADKTLFVLDQRPSSVRACSRALSLCSRCGMATQSFSYALNYCSRHALLTSIDISCALQGVSVYEVKDGGQEVGELLGASLPKELLAARNAFVLSVQELCISLLPDGDQEKARNNSQLEKAQRKTNPFSGFRKRRVACL